MIKAMYCEVYAYRGMSDASRHVSNNANLGRRNTDLRTSIDVDTTVGVARHGGTDSVDNSHAQGTTLDAVPEGKQGIGGLTRLRNEDANVITEDGCLAVQEITGKLDGHGDFCELLENLSGCNGRVVTGTASTEHDATTTTDDRQVCA
jgi:hypothetical protein